RADLQHAAWQHDLADHGAIAAATIDQGAPPAVYPAMDDVLPAVAVDVEHGRRVAVGAHGIVVDAARRVVDPPQLAPVGRPDLQVAEAVEVQELELAVAVDV